MLTGKDWWACPPASSAPSSTSQRPSALRATSATEREGIVAPCNKKQQQQGYAMVALDENGSDSLRPECKKRNYLEKVSLLYLK